MVKKLKFFLISYGYKSLRIKNHYTIFLLKTKRSYNIDYWNKLASILLIPQLLGFYIFSQTYKINKTKRYIIAMFLIILNIVVWESFSEILDDISPNKVLIACLVLFFQNVVLPIGMFVIKDLYFRSIILLIAVGNASNVISYMYPPYQIVDMIGIGYTKQILNLADIYGKMGLLLFFISPLYVFVYLKYIKGLIIIRR